MAGISDKMNSNYTSPASKDSQNLTIIQEDLYALLQSSTKSSVVQEVKQLINEQYNEVKEPWLVNGLYDTFLLTKSSKFLALLLDCRKDPHDRFLCDKIFEELKHKEKRANAFEVLGYIIRKQPSWLYNIPQHSVMKQWIKVLKTEEDIVVMISGVLNLLAFLPTVPGNISSYLDDVFNIFSRLANWRYHLLKLKQFPEIQQIHLEVTLYAYFHRVYGMFPCNFLSYLRTHFSKECSKESKDVYLHVIRPIMSTVKMHPLLVTHTRDHEKSTDRWKRMEVHDIIVDSSRISLLSQESSKEEELEYGEVLDVHDMPHSSPFINFPFPPINIREKPQLMTVTSVCSTVTSTSLLEKSSIELRGNDQRNHGNVLSGTSAAINTLAGNMYVNAATVKTISTSSVDNIESPPEPAIEATPETTPFITPVKDEAFRFARPLPSNQVSKQLKMDISPNTQSPTTTRKSIHATDNVSISASMKSNFLANPSSSISTLKPENSTLPATTPTSPIKNGSMFRFPELSHQIGMQTSTSVLTPENVRRDSLFDRADISYRLSDLATNHAISSSADKGVRTFEPDKQSSIETSNIPLDQTVEDSRDRLQTNKVVKHNFPSDNIQELPPLNEVKPEDPISNESLVNQMQKDVSCLGQYRPSPVKFTNQRPEQFPVKPKPERVPLSNQLQDTKQSSNTSTDVKKEVYEKQDNLENHKHVLSLETLKDLSDFGKEEIDKSRPATASGEGISVTPSFSSNSSNQFAHKTRVSPTMIKTISDNKEDQKKISIEFCSSSDKTDPDVSTRNVTDNSTTNVSRVNNFVRQVRGRMRYISLCASSDDVTSEVASILAKFVGTPGISSAAMNKLYLSVQKNGEAKSRMLKSSSCPDLFQLHHTIKTNIHDMSAGTVVESKNQIRQFQNNAIANAIHKEVQTETFVVYPYEHLFPLILPQTTLEQKSVTKMTEKAEASSANSDNHKNPYDILDEYIARACDKEKYTKLLTNTSGKLENESSLLKAEIGLLQNQVLYERHRRETLGIRNRRLLSKTKSSRILEEANKALRDQLLMKQSEIITLRNQLEQVRKEKHAVEDDRAANAKQRDKEIEKLVLENGQLKQTKRELEDQVKKQEKDLTCANAEINKLQSSLFNSMSEVDVLRGKAEGKIKAEAELVNLRKEVLLLGEMQRRYREKISLPRPGEQEQQRLFRNAYENQIAQMGSALLKAKSEMDVAKGRAQELEALILKKDQVISEQKALHNQILEEYDAKKPETEEAYNSLLVQNLQLEQRILELNSQIDRSPSGMRQRRGNYSTGHQRGTSSGSLSSQSNRSLVVSPTSPGYGEIPGSMSGVFLGQGKPKSGRFATVTANVDMPPPRQLTVPLVEEKSSFIIGSPPSSSDGGSIGSDNSALIQRALGSGGPINLETAPLPLRQSGARRQSQGGTSRRIETSESASTLMTHRSGSSNGSLQTASPEISGPGSIRDAMAASITGVSLREGSENSAASSMNGHKQE